MHVCVGSLSLVECKKVVHSLQTVLLQPGTGHLCSAVAVLAGGHGSVVASSSVLDFFTFPAGENGSDLLAAIQSSFLKITH